MPLDSKKKARIKAMGGRVTTVEEWLDLSSEEVAIIDMKIRLGEELKALRRKKRISQEKAAKILQTSQGRVSKMEKGQASWGVHPDISRLKRRSRTVGRSELQPQPQLVAAG
jgi:predicted XRE-type DNA-binding protein